MKVTFQPVHSLDDASCKKATGKTFAGWFKELDAGGFLEKGRRETVSHVYTNTGKDIWWSVTIAVEYEKSKNIKKKDGLYEGYGICATKTIAAPLERIYAAISEAGAMSGWMGARSPHRSRTAAPSSAPTVRAANI